MILSIQPKKTLNMVLMSQKKKEKKTWNMIWSPQGFHTDCLVHAACPRRPMQACCCLAPFSTSVSGMLCPLSGNSQTRPATFLTCAMPLEHTQELKTSSPPLMHQCGQGKGLYHSLSWTSIQKVIWGKPGNALLGGRGWWLWGFAHMRYAIWMYPGAEDIIPATDSLVQTGEGATVHCHEPQYRRWF